MRRAIFIILLAALASCSKNSEPAGLSPYSLLDSLAKAETFDQALFCYSNKTRKAVSDVIYNSRGGISKVEFFPVLAFLKGAITWEIRAEKIIGEQAEFDVLILDHITDNMTGFVMPCKMVKENGKWRIDMEKNILSLLGTKKNGGEYLEKKLKSYQ